MSEVLLPPWIIPEEEPQEPLDEGSSVFRAAFAPGIAQRQSFGGLRLKLSRRHTVRLEEKAQLLSILRSTKGQYNALRTKVHFAPRGSFPASELLSNNTFANGTTGWTGSNATLSVADRVMRVTRTNSLAAELIQLNVSGLTQYAPYALRSFIVDGRGTAGLNIGRAMAAGVGAGTEVVDYSVARGLGTVALVARGTTADAQYPAVINSATGLAGDYIDIQWCSLSRCALVDNGRNSLLRSDEFDHAAWSKPGATVVANVATAPDGTLTGDAIKEDNSTGGHGISQAYAVGISAADFVLGVSLKAAERTWAFIALIEDTGATIVSAYINLATGAIGTTATGANWSSLRTPIAVDRGNGWFDCYIVARKTNAATQLTAFIQLATGDGGASYAGDNTSRILGRRATSGPGSVPSRLTLVTTTATSGTAQTGSALHIKGLPASTNGLLLPEDVFEINGELKSCTAALDSDAAGLGYLQFEPALVRSPADNDPVIIADPMGKFLVSNIKIENRFGTEAVVTYDLEHIYE